MDALAGVRGRRAPAPVDQSEGITTRRMNFLGNNIPAPPRRILTRRMVNSSPPALRGRRARPAAGRSWREVLRSPSPKVPSSTCHPLGDNVLFMLFRHADATLQRLDDEADFT